MSSNNSCTAMSHLNIDSVYQPVTNTTHTHSTENPDADAQAPKKEPRVPRVASVKADEKIKMQLANDEEIARLMAADEHHGRGYFAQNHRNREQRVRSPKKSSPKKPGTNTNPSPKSKPKLTKVFANARSRITPNNKDLISADAAANDSNCSSDNDLHNVLPPTRSVRQDGRRLPPSSPMRRHSLSYSSLDEGLTTSVKRKRETIDPATLPAARSTHEVSEKRAQLLWVPNDDADVQMYLRRAAVLLQHRQEEMSLDRMLTIFWRNGYEIDKTLTEFEHSPPTATWENQHGRALDFWSESEVVKFERAFIAFGKDFHTISKHVQTRQVSECVSLFYRWKRTERGTAVVNEYKNSLLMSVKSRRVRQMFIPLPEAFLHDYDEMPSEMVTARSSSSTASSTTSSPLHSPSTEQQHNSNTMSRKRHRVKITTDCDDTPETLSPQAHKADDHDVDDHDDNVDVDVDVDDGVDIDDDVDVDVDVDDDDDVFSHVTIDVTSPILDWESEPRMKRRKKGTRPISRDLNSKFQPISTMTTTTTTIPPLPQVIPPPPTQTTVLAATTRPRATATSTSTSRSTSTPTTIATTRRKPLGTEQVTSTSTPTPTPTPTPPAPAPKATNGLPPSSVATIVTSTLTPTSIPTPTPTPIFTSSTPTPTITSISTSTSTTTSTPTPTPTPRSHNTFPLIEKPKKLKTTSVRPKLARTGTGAGTIETIKATKHSIPTPKQKPKPRKQTTTSKPKPTTATPTVAAVAVSTKPSITTTPKLETKLATKLVTKLATKLATKQPPKQSQSTSSPKASRQGSEIFIVESVVATRLKNAKREYKVKWEGYPHNQNTWEPEAHLANNVVLKAFLLEQKAKLV